MYCKHCGREIADDSKFCQHCGKSQGSGGSSLSNKPIWIIYLVWSIANFYLLTGEKYITASKYFFPYGYNHLKYDSSSNFGKDLASFCWNKQLYDFSEFLIYVFIAPLILYIAYRLFIVIKKRKEK